MELLLLFAVGWLFTLGVLIVIALIREALLWVNRRWIGAHYLDDGWRRYDNFTPPDDNGD